MKDLIAHFLAAQLVQATSQEEKKKNGLAFFLGLTAAFSYLTGLVFLVMLAYESLENAAGSEVSALALMGIGMLLLAGFCTLVSLLTLRSKKPKTSLLFDITENLVSGFVQGLNKAQTSEIETTLTTTNVAQHPAVHTKTARFNK